MKMSTLQLFCHFRICSLSLYLWCGVVLVRVCVFVFVLCCVLRNEIRPDNTKTIHKFKYRDTCKGQTFHLIGWLVEDDLPALCECIRLSM